MLPDQAPVTFLTQQRYDKRFLRISGGYPSPEVDDERFHSPDARCSIRDPIPASRPHDLLNSFELHVETLFSFVISLLFISPEPARTCDLALLR
jgi:hypothetical protein